MMRTVTAVGAMLGVLLTASVAGAQKAGQFGDQGQFIFSADRLVPIFAFTQNKVTDDSVNPERSTTVTGTSISLLWGANSIFSGSTGNLTNPNGGNPTFYTTPRVGFDYTIIPNLTIGGDVLAFFTLGGSSTTAQGGRSVSNDSPSANVFGIVPRVGYILGMSDIISFWLRGGLSFYHAGTSIQDNRCNNQNDTSEIHVFGVDLDPQIVISPINHFAFIAGPALDVGFAGGASTTNPGNTCNSTVTNSVGYSSLNFGLTGGLLGWF
jgi:hypothetical protein